MGVQCDIVFVGDEHDGVALLVEAFEERHDFVAGGGVEVAGRFVGQQNRWIVDQGASYGNTLALTAGELVGLVVHALFEIHLAHGELGALQALVGGHAGVDQGQLDVVQRAGARQQVEGLENEADFLVANAGQLIVAHLADQIAVDVVLALAGRVEAADQVHQGRFAGPRRSHDRDILAALDLDIHTGNGVDLLVAHDIGLPEIEGADDNSILLELLAALDQFFFYCCRHRLILVS